jgi:hypothetical protein
MTAETKATRLPERVSYERAAVHAVLGRKADIATVVAGLMSRPLKRED